MSVDQKILDELREMCAKAVKDYLAMGYASEEGNRIQIVFEKSVNQFIVTLLAGEKPFWHFPFKSQKTTVDEMMAWIEKTLHPIHFQ